MVKGLKKNSNKKLRVGLFSPSGAVPRIETEIGIAKLEKAGFEVVCHPDLFNQWRYFAGDDVSRALQFTDFLMDPSIDVIWAARGGSGALRTLPIVDEVLTQSGFKKYFSPGQEKKTVKKTLIGFSDVTLLLDYARSRLGLRAIHGPMPGTAHFFAVTDKSLKILYTKIESGETIFPRRKLKPIGNFSKEWLSQKSGARPEKVTGGNLTVLQTAIGTPFDIPTGGFLFLEDVGESLYRIDRAFEQMALAQKFKSVRAILLGTFSDCVDHSPAVFKDHRLKTKIPLRPTLEFNTWKKDFFSEFSALFEIPVLEGLHCGHAPDAVEFMDLGREVAL